MNDAGHLCFLSVFATSAHTLGLFRGTSWLPSRRRRLPYHRLTSARFLAAFQAPQASISSAYLVRFCPAGPANLATQLVVTRAQVDRQKDNSDELAKQRKEAAEEHRFRAAVQAAQNQENFADVKDKVMDNQEANARNGDRSHCRSCQCLV